MTEFRNGFANWHETHYEMVTAINDMIDSEYDNNIKEFYFLGGRGAMYELAHDWTDEFEEMYEGEDWEITNYYDMIEIFITDKTK